MVVKERLMQRRPAAGGRGSGETVILRLRPVRMIAHAVVGERNHAPLFYPERKTRLGFGVFCMQNGAFCISSGSASI